MCFSAPVSFVASGALAIAGAASVAKVKSKRQLPLALIPVFFGVQQLIEGMIWLGVGESMINPIFVYGFLLFAYLLWPIYFPLSMMLVEPEDKRKAKMKAILVMGVIVAIYLFVISVFIYSVEVQVVGCHIGHPYSDNRWYALSLPFYLGAVGLAPLFSSYKILRIFGWTIIVSCIVTLFFTLTAFTSVWCFAAAILSLMIYWFFRTEGGK